MGLILYGVAPSLGRLAVIRTAAIARLRIAGLMQWCKGLARAHKGSCSRLHRLRSPWPSRTQISMMLRLLTEYISVFLLGPNELANYWPGVRSWQVSLILSITFNKNNSIVTKLDPVVAEVEGFRRLRHAAQGLGRKNAIPRLYDWAFRCHEWEVTLGTIFAYAYIGVSMNPINGQKTTNPYTCGNPGAKYPKSDRAGGCNWDMKPPSNDYQWVTAGGNHCQANSDCQQGTCGISFNPGHADLLQKTCGSLLGYWSADQICGIIPSFGAPFNCQERLPAPHDGLTNFNLYACVGIGSCYQQGADASCCGCANWNEEGLTVPPFPDTENCKNKNPTWNERVKNTLLWLKRACPTAYTYPYDDMSSTFTCKAMADGVNSANYEIVFCPQNEGNGSEQFLE